MIKKIKNNFGIVIIFLLVILPVIFWLFTGSIVGRFHSANNIFRSLGQITGLIGMVFISINFVLSTRLKILDTLFRGLNKVYVNHHLIGTIAFCLILFHPVFLIVQYLVFSLKSAFNFVISIDNWALNLGKIGLLIFIILLAITFYSNFKYEVWKKTHKFLGLVLLLGGLHAFLINSDISNNSLLRYYMLVIFIIALLAYSYRTVFTLYKVHEYKYRLKSKKMIAKNIFEISFEPQGKRIKYLPGQFAFIRLQGRGILSESHPFSITSLSQEGELDFIVKDLGDYTQALLNAGTGSIYKIEGPFGYFNYEKMNCKRQIWIAGGIGITPFLGMARQIDLRGQSDYQIDLYYSVKDEEEMICKEEFEGFAKKNNNFHFFPIFSKRDGRLTVDYVQKNSKDLKTSDILICGPHSFMSSLREQFVEKGIINNKIHSEEFNL